MNEYNIIVGTGISGHEIELLVNADNKQEAEKLALEEARKMIEIMRLRLHIAKIEEW